jgi:APA family basic amino acid/polyamine antiporter
MASAHPPPRHLQQPEVAAPAPAASVKMGPASARRASPTPDAPSARYASLHVAFWKKPLHFIAAEDAHGGGGGTGEREMERTLGLFDLIMIGIGGTVGSGVFATAGLIASAYAGPAATLSWLIAGAGCLLSGLSFMELSCLIPSTGSTYAYAYHALGELPALLAGFLLTLEYGVSSAGGARSWSDKFTNWMETELGVAGPEWMKPKDSSVDLYAGLLMIITTAIVLCGMQAGKVFVNVVTMTKISVVTFIIIAGLSKFNSDNVTPWIPPEETNAAGEVVYGLPGVFLGASASFFGYIGYDEVCCLAGEAKNPTKNIPRAVIGTIIGAATLSILATFALVGMQRYSEIDAGESYGKAFSHVGWDWAATIVSTGEVMTMPITSFIGFLAQPRVQYAMAKDGLLPQVFARVDSNGNLFHGTLLCGLAIVTIAVFVPFHVLWNFISLGILVAFNLTNSSLLFVRAPRPLAAGEEQPTVASRADDRRSGSSHGLLITSYLLTSFLAAYHWQKSTIAVAPITASSSMFDQYMNTAGPYVAAVFTVIAVVLMFMLKEAEDAVTASTASDVAKAKRQLPKSGAVEGKPTHADELHSISHRGHHHKDEGGDSGQLVAGGARRSDSASTSSIKFTIGSDDDDDDDGIDSRDGGVLSEQTGSDSSSDIDASANVDNDDDDGKPMNFRAPLVPFTPCVAIFFNWFLFAQMDAASVLLIVLWLLLAVALYFCYSRHRSLAHQQTTRYARIEQHTPSLQA